MHIQMRVSGPVATEAALHDATQHDALTPDVDDEVLVAFEKGDMRHPVLIGALWNGDDKPPEQSPERSLARCHAQVREVSGSADTNP